MSSSSFATISKIGGSVLLGGFLCWCLTVSSCSRSSEKQPEIPAVLAAMQRGDLEAAEAEITRAIALKQGNGRYHYVRGLVRQQRGLLKEALQDFDEAERLKHEPVHLYVSRAWLKKTLADRHGAMADASIAVQRFPNVAMAYVARGAQFLIAEKHQEALQDFEKALTLDSTESMALFGVATVKWQQGDSLSALEYFNKAVAPTSTDAEITFTPDTSVANTQKEIDRFIRAAVHRVMLPYIYVDRGVLRSELGDQAGALADFDAAIRLSPRLADAYVERSYLFFQQGDYKKAIDGLTTAIQIDDHHTGAYVLRGTAWIRLRSYNLALSDLNKALAISPTLETALAMRGFAKIETGDLEGGIADANEALRIQPTLVTAYLARAEAALKAHNLSAAHTDLSEAIRLQPKNVVLLHKRSQLREMMGDLKGAAADKAEAKQIVEQR